MSIAHTLHDLCTDHRKIKIIDTGKKTGPRQFKKWPDLFKGEHLFKLQT